MAELIQAVRCPDDNPDCRSRQFLVQAFPHGPHPGRWGSLGSLAAGIVEAVSVWESQPDGANAGLIINLSVGWEVEAGEQLPAAPTTLLMGANATVPPPVQAVYAALAWASCRGALVFAAAGNDRGIVCEQSEPIAPAAWESIPAPTADECALYFGAGVDPGTGGSLVYAVGGIMDEDGRPLANARRGSTPARVLHGLHAVVELAPSGETSVFDPSYNGGLAVDYVYSIDSLKLENAGDTVGLTFDGVTLDAVTYTYMAPWPPPNPAMLGVLEGSSLSLDPQLYDPVSNDLGESWCHPTMSFEAGDFGTPGAVNEPCP